MSEEIRVMSSLAMKSASELLAPRFEREEKVRVVLQFVGGVDIGKRIRAREPVDLVMLAANALDDFIREGLVQASSRVDLVRSIIGVAVKSGAPHPDISSAQALQSAVDAARDIAYSSGPSGVYLAQVFERWRVPKEKLHQTAPGVPSGGLLVSGEADLAFQQVSELLAVKGIDLVGPLPEALQLVTIFSAGIPVTATNAKAARAFATFLTSRAVVAELASCGLEPA